MQAGGKASASEEACSLPKRPPSKPSFDHQKCFFLNLFTTIRTHKSGARRSSALFGLVSCSPAASEWDFQAFTVIYPNFSCFPFHVFLLSATKGRVNVAKTEHIEEDVDFGSSKCAGHNNKARFFTSDSDSFQCLQILPSMLIADSRICQ